jgi:Calcium binding
LTARQRSPKGTSWPPAKAKLIAMIKEAVVDAYTESEQRTGFYTLLDERLGTPFDTEVFGAAVTVERLDMTNDEQLIAICPRPLATGDSDSRAPSPESPPARCRVDRGLPLMGNW